jgi:hypothetical protein
MARININIDAPTAAEATRAGALAVALAAENAVDLLNALVALDDNALVRLLKEARTELRRRAAIAQTAADRWRLDP